MKKSMLILLPLLVLGACKQKSTLLKEKKQAIAGIEKRLNYSPQVLMLSPFLNEEDLPEDITVYLNHNNKIGEHKVTVNGEPLESITFTDLEENPPQFGIPELSELCETTGPDTVYAAHKYRSTNLEGYGTQQLLPSGMDSQSVGEEEAISVYAFSVSGQCNGEETRCALIYAVGEGMQYNTMIPTMLDPPLFEIPPILAGVMGLDGVDQNCQHLFDKGVPLPGCMDENALNYDELANRSVPESCIYPPTMGCMDINATNYNPMAQVDDGSCGSCNPGFIKDNGICVIDIIGPISGCTNPIAENYNPNATVEDGTCIVLGCTAPGATNYNPEATEYDNSCICEQGFEVTQDGSACVPVQSECGPSFSPSLSPSCSVFP